VKFILISFEFTLGLQISYSLRKTAQTQLQEDTNYCA